MKNIVLMLVCALVVCSSALAADGKVTVSQLRDKPDEWFTSAEGKQFIANIIAHQRPEGGWYKTYDVSKPPNPGDRPDSGWTMPTIDNNATYTELRLLARAHRLDHNAAALEAFNRGLDYLFAAQYPSGGWPQRFPRPNNYGKQITLNDHAMAGVMNLLFDVVNSPDFEFVDADRRAKAKAAFDKGVDCLLKLQVKQDGKLAAWAQQYDPDTLQPAKARAYELPGLASDESIGVLRMLMRIKDPSPEVKNAIKAGVEWVARSKISGMKLVRTPDPKLPHGVDVTLQPDASAPPLWARYYELDTNKPFFCNRDGHKVFKLEEVDPERRAGYAWMRPYGEKLPGEYAAWLGRIGESK
jgi:PelA/Pel-15E family pectate lyase